MSPKPARASASQLAGLELIYFIGLLLAIGRTHGQSYVPTLMSDCVHAQTSSVLQSCSINRNELAASSPRLSVASLLHECINDTGEGRANGRPLRFVAPDTLLMRTLSQMGNVSFAQATGITVNFSLVPFLTYVVTRQRQLQDPKPPNATDGYDLLMATATAFGDASQVERKLPDLSYLVAGDVDLSWNEIPAQFRAVGPTYDGSVRALPLHFSSFLQYYHLDIFRRDNLTVPQTWDEFAELAERYHGQDGLLGACIMPIGCNAESLLLRFIFGSYVQTEGPSHGVFWDPQTLEPLVNTPAMEAALKMFRRLRAVGPQTSDAPLCLMTRFIRGQCLLAISDGAQFKTGSIGAPELTRMRGHMGFAPIPGSAYVLDRATKHLVGCDEKRCPLATGKTAEGIPVNRPIAISSAILLVNGLSPFQYQFFAYQLASYLSSPAVIGTRGLLMEVNEIQPVRESDMSLANVPLWVARGYDEGDATRYLTTYGEILRNPNINADLRLRLTSKVTEALVAAAVQYNNVSLNASLPRVMSQIEAALNGIVAAEGREAFASQYRRSLNWVPPKPVSPAAASGQGKYTKRIVAIAVGSICGTLLVASILLAAFFMQRRRAGRRGHLNLVEAPGVGRQTTLCITDIQDSTTLWEELSDVMNLALDVHHSIIRRLLVMHLGYECLTEGDSFVLAFHTTSHAVHFCLDAQQALLDAPWPRELLRHESAVRGSHGESPTAEITLQGSFPSTGATPSGKASGKKRMMQQVRIQNGNNHNDSNLQQQQQPQQQQPQQQQQAQPPAQLPAGHWSNVTTNPCEEDQVATLGAGLQAGPVRVLASHVLGDSSYASHMIMDSRQYPPPSEDGNGASLLYTTVDRPTPQFDSALQQMPNSFLGTNLTASLFSQPSRLGAPAAAATRDQSGGSPSNDFHNHSNSSESRPPGAAPSDSADAAAVAAAALPGNTTESTLSDDDAVAVMGSRDGSNGGGGGGGTGPGGSCSHGGSARASCVAGSTSDSRVGGGRRSPAQRPTVQIAPSPQLGSATPSAAAAAPMEVQSPVDIEAAALRGGRNSSGSSSLKALLGGLTNSRGGGGAAGAFAIAGAVPVGSNPGLGFGRFFRRGHQGGGGAAATTGCAVSPAGPSADVATSDPQELMTVRESGAPEDLEYDFEKAQRHRLGRIHEYDNALPFRILQTEARSMSVPVMQRPPGLIAAAISPNQPSSATRPMVQRIAARPSFSGPSPLAPSTHVPSRLSGNRARKSVSKTISMSFLVDAVRGVGGDLGRLGRLDCQRGDVSQGVLSKRPSISSTATDISLIGETSGTGDAAAAGANSGGAPITLTLEAMFRYVWKISLPQPRRTGADSPQSTLADCSAAAVAGPTGPGSTDVAIDQPDAGAWAQAGPTNAGGSAAAAAVAPSLPFATSGGIGGADSKGVLVFRGLRVRAGMSCGVLSESDILRETVNGRVQYTGRCMRLAKLVSDAAHGGMVLLSDSARAALEADGEGWAAVVKRCQPLVLWMGRHSLAHDLSDVHLFQVVTQALAGRLVLLQRPLRTLGMQRPLMGIMAAPMVVGAVARLMMPGAATLMAWDAEVTGRALDIAYVALLEELRRAKGRPYVVEGALGLHHTGGGGGIAAGVDSAGWALSSVVTSSPLPVERSARLQVPGAAGGGGGASAGPSSATASVPLMQTSMDLGALLMASPPSLGRQRPSKSAKELGVCRPGVITVVFDSADAAASWLLQALEVLPLLPWPTELLEHPLCEPLDLDLLAAVVTGQEAGTPLPPNGSPPRGQPRRRDSIRSMLSAAGSRTFPTRRPATLGSLRTRPSGDAGREEAFGSIQECNAEIVSGNIIVDDPDSPQAGQLSLTTVPASAGSCSPPSLTMSRTKARGRPDFSGLRAACVLSFGDLAGHLPPVGSLWGQVQYKGRAWHSLNKLSAKARVGQVCTNTATVGYLRPELASLMVVVKSAQDNAR